MTITLPPSPPSPPEGPPRGTPSSRRNAAEPSPPSPALTWMTASSMNGTRGVIASDLAGRLTRVRWMQAFRRAVIVPGARRAAPVWAGSGIVGSIVFGGSGMQPHDLTTMALHDLGVGAALAVTWLLLFLPTAR